MTWYANAEGRHGANGRKGDLGEALVKQYCEDNGLVHEDKQDRHSQVVLKIDCIIEGNTVDVKTNAYKGFLCVEIAKRDGRNGWIYSTTADEIYGVDLDNKEIYKYNVEDMQDYVQKNMRRAKQNKFGDTILWVPKGISIIERLQ